MEQAEEAAVEKVPALQFVHAGDPARDQVPALHGWQDVIDVANCVDDHVPALQSVQEFVPTVDQVPALHD